MRCRRAGTRQGAVTTASRDAGAQVRIIYVNASVMALGAARGVRRARVGLGTSRRWCSVFAHCSFALLQVVTLALSHYSVADLFRPGPHVAWKGAARLVPIRRQN